MGKCFLQLVGKHFPKHHKFRKIFNRNTGKVSYSCLPNMKSKISKHNRKILATIPQEPTQNVKTCSCPGNTTCPMDGKCLEKDILYIARITSDLPNYNAKEYKGTCSTTWKERYGNHKKAFRNNDYEKDTALSEEVWNIKRKDGQCTIQWQKHQNPSYTPETTKCSLCMNERLEIALYKVKPSIDFGLTNLFINSNID